MATVLKAVSDWFWDERLWFPPGVNWSTLRSTEYEQYPEFSDMYRPIGYAFLFLLVRLVFEWTLARPLGRFLGLEDTGSELPNILRRIYWRYKVLTGSASLDGPPEQRRVRTKSGRFRPIVIPKSTLDKFCECCWRFTYYFGIFWYGLYVLWDKPWFWDQAHCWYGYPFQTVDSDIRLYYMLESAFYWSLMLSQFTDTHRKDYEMFLVHHIATILLLWFSWADNFVRVGSLVLVVHDASDFWLEAGKMASYTKRHTLSTAMLVCFTLSWFVTRCGLYPIKIIYSCMIEAPALIPWFPAYYVFNALLLTLQVLHVLWSIMLLKSVYNTLRSGVVVDTRSDDESSDENDEQTKKRNGKIKNKVKTR